MWKQGDKFYRLPSPIWNLNAFANLEDAFASRTSTGYHGMAMAKAMVMTVAIAAVTGKGVLPGSKGIFEYFKTENIPEIESQNSSLIDSQEDLLPDDIL